VDELLITARVRELATASAGSNGSAARQIEGVLPEPAVEPSAAGEAEEADAETVRFADQLITLAAQTSAKITFVEDAELLSDYGGVAATLRFTI
jgi:peptide subunit release factor 1 (eRF1)